MAYHRKVIKIRAEDSPNVRWGIAQRRLGIKPANDILVDGVITYREYLHRRNTWDEIHQCIGLDAEFYEGAELLMFPPHWLNYAENNNRKLFEEHYKKTGNRLRRQARAIGCDPAEGGDKTCWSVVDEYGLMALISMKTPDTSIIPKYTIKLMRKYNVAPEYVVFDRGGGGKEHADRLRAIRSEEYPKGYKVRTVGFGESLTPDPRARIAKINERVEDKEVRYAYKRRRDQMYGDLREYLDPANERNFCIPEEYVELRRQLAPIPLIMDSEGRLRLPPKRRRKGSKSEDKSLEEIIGHSPDEADSFVLALHGMIYKPNKIRVGAYDKKKGTNRMGRR